MMTKEELEKEAEEYADKFWGASPSMMKALAEAYAKGAESREKLIAKLEKENAELKEKLEDAEKVRDYWKGSSFDWWHKCTSRKPFKAAVKAQKQLAKAKELIEELASSLSVVGECEEEECELLGRAEQFLNSEVEK